MNRNRFIKIIGGTFAMATLSSFRSFADSVGNTGSVMPVLFIGHGSPMNGIEDNEFSRRWSKLGSDIQQPVAVLCISAHWLTNGTCITAMPQPKTIHDFGGFPPELYNVQYPAPGSPAIAHETVQSISKTQVTLDHDWGLDHGCWTIMRHMYPKANIPILQLSIDYNKPAKYHYELAQELMFLRMRGVLIIGSGNMVHNLRMIAWNKINEAEYGYDWAIEANNKFKNLITSHNHEALIEYDKLGRSVENAIPTPDHFYPLLYALALQQSTDNIEIFNDKCVAGSLTMTSVRIG